MASPYDNKASSSALGKASSKNNEGSAPLPGAAGTSPQQPTCPECGSSKTWKDGIRETCFGPVQRYLCRSCGYRFSDPSKHGFNGLGTSEGLQTVYTKQLKSKVNIPTYCRGQDETVKATSFSQKGLKKTSDTAKVVKMEIPAKEKPAGGTEKQTVGISPTDQASAKGKIIEFTWWMKKQGYAESTIEGRARVIKVLMQRGANLLDPESVKDVIAQQKWSEARKAVAVKAYTCFLRMVGGNWKPPICRDIRKLPFIPLERKIDDLIACCNQHIAAFLRIAKETGARAGEIYSLTWSDVDFERQTIRINAAEKNSNPRIFRISNTLTAILNRLPKESPYLFHHYASLKHLRRCFQRYRKRAAIKLGNPRILQITFHTLRH